MSKFARDLYRRDVDKEDGNDSRTDISLLFLDYKDSMCLCEIYKDKNILFVLQSKESNYYINIYTTLVVIMEWYRLGLDLSTNIGANYSRDLKFKAGSATLH